MIFPILEVCTGQRTVPDHQQNFCAKVPFSYSRISHAREKSPPSPFIKGGMGGFMIMIISSP